MKVLLVWFLFIGWWGVFIRENWPLLLENTSVQKVITRFWTKMKNVQTCYLNKLAKLRRHASRVHFAKINFG